MSDVCAALESIAAAIRADLPTLRTCGVIESALDEHEIARELRAAPAAMVGLRQFRLGGAVRGVPQLEISPAVYLLVDGVRYDLRMAEIAAIARRVTDLLQRSDLGGIARSRPRNLTVTPRFSGVVDSYACTIWEVDWDQEIAGKAPADDEALHLLRRVSVDFGAVAPEAAPEEPVCEACAAMAGGNAGGGDA